MLKGISLPQPLGPAATPTFSGMWGVTDGSDAAAGKIGEFLTAVLPSTSGIALTTALAATIVSLALTAGDWDVEGSSYFLPNGIAALSAMECSISTVNNAHGGEGTLSFLSTTSLGGAQGMATPTVRFSVSVPTTVFLVASAAFTLSTCKAGGVLRARRVR